MRHRDQRPLHARQQPGSTRSGTTASPIDGVNLDILEPRVRRGARLGPQPDEQVPLIGARLAAIVDFRAGARAGRRPASARHGGGNWRRERPAPAAPWTGGHVALVAGRGRRRPPRTPGEAPPVGPPCWTAAVYNDAELCPAGAKARRLRCAGRPTDAAGPAALDRLKRRGSGRGRSGTAGRRCCSWPRDRLRRQAAPLRAHALGRGVSRRRRRPRSSPRARSRR